MFDKFSQSWNLLKASGSVLRSDKELLLFPALSALCTVIVAASFFVPAAFAGLFEHFGDKQRMSPALAALGFLFYLVQYFIIVFFNSALVGAALIRLRGGDPTLRDGFRIALSKLPAILGYALIAATVGICLRALQERAGFIGRWVVSMIGAAWSVATFLAVPVLVNQNVGPIQAITHSVTLLKKTWGQNLVGNVGIGLVFGLLTLASIGAGVLLLMAGLSAKSVALSIAAVAISGVMVLLLALIQAALQGIFAAAVYRFAEEGEIGTAFAPELVAHAFKVKA